LEKLSIDAFINMEGYAYVMPFLAGAPMAQMPSLYASSWHAQIWYSKRWGKCLWPQNQGSNV